MPIVDHRGNVIESPKPVKHVRPVSLKASMDAGLNIPDLAGHWVDSDFLGPNASIPRHIRASIRSKARMERNQNSYLVGILQTLAHFIIGTGPRLQMQLTHEDGTPDTETNLLVEREWAKWTKHIRLAELLRTALIAKKTDGEAFLAVVRGNEQISKLTGYGITVQLYETEQVEADRLWTLEDDDGGAGIRYDAKGYPTRYPVKAQHPGENADQPYDKIRWIPESHMCHLFRQDRPGQKRGVSEILSSLPLFALTRRLTMATVTGMEKASSITGVLETDAITGPDGEPINSVSEDDWMTELAVSRNTLLTLASGQSMKEFGATMPTTQYDVFVRSLIREIARCLSIPYNIAAGDSSEYNYSSGRLDHQSFFIANDVERSYIETVCLDKIFNRWFKIFAAIHMGLDPDDIEGYHQPHSWMWNGVGHVDPEKEAKATMTDLALGRYSRGTVMQQQGVDIDVEDKLSAEHLGFDDVQSFRKALAANLLNIQPVQAENKSDGNSQNNGEGGGPSGRPEAEDS